MENENKERIKASNIIWNAADDYAFHPEIKAYDENGKADLYRNYIIGAVHKNYDYSLLSGFFGKLEEDNNHVLYKNLTWLALEYCTYEKEKDARPVLESMRQSYAERVLSQEELNPSDDIFNEIKTAHYQRVLGQEPKVKDSTLDLLDALEFDEAMNTEQIIYRMKEILKAFFEFDTTNNEDDELKKMTKNRKIIHFGGKRRLKAGNPYQKRFDIGSAEMNRGIKFEGKGKKLNKISFHWHHLLDQRENNLREYIQNYFGTSILTEPRTKALEQILCDGNHKTCHLHFTRGEFDDNADAAFQKNVASIQRENNINHYKDNLARNSNSISKLTNKIRNAMLVNLESSFIRSDSGKLISGKVWKNIYLDDNKIFVKNYQDDIGDLSVDIMLDASASQIYRQETIAAQGYIIAESLTRCHIPVRVYSFCNLRSYTTIHLFRDYREVKKNDNIFRYSATGYNRDGLAIRTALHMMKDTPFENKILIVISDGKPNDVQSISDGEFAFSHHEYSDEMAVNDTAQEVRKGLLNGVSILGVFTGDDDCIPAAKMIYGHNLAHIESPERFADIVGVLMHNVLMTL